MNSLRGQFSLTSGFVFFLLLFDSYWPNLLLRQKPAMSDVQRPLFPPRAHLQGDSGVPMTEESARRSCQREARHGGKIPDPNALVVALRSVNTMFPHGPTTNSAYVVGGFFYVPDAGTSRREHRNATSSAPQSNLASLPVLPPIFFFRKQPVATGQFLIFSRSPDVFAPRSEYASFFALLIACHAFVEPKPSPLPEGETYSIILAVSSAA